MSEEGLLERLVITEEGDMAESVSERGPASGSLVAAQSRGAETPLKKEAEHTGEDKSGDHAARKEMCFEEQEGAEMQRAAAERDQTGEVVVTEEEHGQNRGDGESGGQAHEMMGINRKPERAGDTEGDMATQKDPQVDIRRLNSSEQQPDGTENQEEDPKKARRLTPDFPDALYELLCTLTEGRRLNDQRCSFRLEGGMMRRRRCHSEPNASKPANRVVFSSMTSLQKEEFFELVATAQARRLDDQRAQLEKSRPPKPKSRGFRGSIKQLSFVKRPAPAPVPVPVPKEDLYNMILATQAQGRLEDQRSRAPGPMDDEDFFSLLLRVQGGRMDEQRTELPGMLLT
ncbi:G-protein-signaling modulator 1 [Cebidichthys violaceus]|uniref:G-protein-signaling modulator 1 n=1 Tax=Cebidichthys violaceus TaxID=271503 RepID=UPI0035C9ACFD